MPDSLTVLLIVAAIAAMYFLCIRPMRRGECSNVTTGASRPDTERSREIAELREELRILRAEEGLHADDSSGPTQPPAPSS